MPKIQVSFRLPATIEKRDEGLWVATCPIFDVVTQGETYERARVNIEDALAFFLESCFRRGTIGQVLKEAGLSPDSEQSSEWPADQPSVEINVPLPFVIAGQDRNHYTCP